MPVLNIAISAPVFLSNALLIKRRLSASIYWVLTTIQSLKLFDLILMVKVCILISILKERKGRLLEAKLPKFEKQGWLRNKKNFLYILLLLVSII